MGFSAPPIALPQGLYQPSKTNPAGIQPGTYTRLPDGRAFRFVRTAPFTLGDHNTASRLAAMPTIQATLWIALAIQATQAIGDRTITIQNGAHAIAANQFAGGYLNIYSYDPMSPLPSMLLAIDSHPAIAGGAIGKITVRDPLPQVVTTAGGQTKCDLLPNPYVDVGMYDTTPPLTGVLGPALGMILTSWVSAVPLYDWIQVEGLAQANYQGTLGTVGAMVSPGSNGVVQPYAAGLQIVGRLVTQNGSGRELIALSGL
jgi:hypothetical protein